MYKKLGIGRGHGRRSSGVQNPAGDPTPITSTERRKGQLRRVDAWIKTNGIPENGSELLELQAYIEFGDSTKVLAITPQIGESVYVSRSYDSLQDILPYIENKYFVDLKEPFKDYGNILDKMRKFNARAYDTYFGPKLDPHGHLVDLRTKPKLNPAEILLAEKIKNERLWAMTMRMGRKAIDPNEGIAILEYDWSYDKKIQELEKAKYEASRWADAGKMQTIVDWDRLSPEAKRRMHNAEPYNIIHRQRNFALFQKLGREKGLLTGKPLSGVKGGVWSEKDRDFLNTFFPAGFDEFLNSSHYFSEVAKSWTAREREMGFPIDQLADPTYRKHRIHQGLDRLADSMEDFVPKKWYPSVDPVWKTLSALSKSPKDVARERAIGSAQAKIKSLKYMHDMEKMGKELAVTPARRERLEREVKRARAKYGAELDEPLVHVRIGDPAHYLSDKGRKIAKNLLHDLNKSSWAASEAGRRIFEPGGLTIVEPSEAGGLTLVGDKQFWSPELIAHREKMKDLKVKQLKDIEALKPPSEAAIAKQAAPPSLGGPSADLTTPKEKLYTPEETEIPEDYEFD